MYTDEGSETEGLEGLNKEVEEWRFQRSLLELIIQHFTSRYWKFQDYIKRQILQPRKKTDYYCPTLLLPKFSHPSSPPFYGFIGIHQADSSAQARNRGTFRTYTRTKVTSLRQRLEGTSKTITSARVERISPPI